MGLQSYWNFQRSCRPGRLTTAVKVLAWSVFVPLSSFETGDGKAFSS
jgi:hypothetical protein